MPEETLSSLKPFVGRILELRVDQVRTESGHETTREVVEHPGSVAILPVTETGNVILIRQFRYAVGSELLELPAGTREPDESAEVCAVRELREETGYQAGQLEFLCRFYVSPGWCDEEVICYRATDLRYVGFDPEQDEVIEPVDVGPGEILGLLRDGNIADGKTIIALQMHIGALPGADM